MDQPSIEPIARAERPIAAGTTIGHVHLRTADIDRVRDFYVGVLGFNTWKSAGTHEAVYISDPDGNDLELYWDRPQSEWALDAHGHLAFAGGELDLEDLAGDPRSDL